MPTGTRTSFVFDDVRTGLAVRVTAAGSKSYLCQYTFGGQKRRIPLGNCSALSLAGARKAVQAIIGDVAKGLDPAVERKEQFAAARAKKSRDSLTLGVLMQSWKQLHLVHRRPRYAAEAIRALSVAFARHRSSRGRARPGDRCPGYRWFVAARPCGARRSDCCLRQGVFWLGAQARQRQFEPVRGAASGAGPGARPLLTDVELAAIWRAATEMGGLYGLIVRFLALTGQRRDRSLACGGTR